MNYNKCIKCNVEARNIIESIKISENNAGKLLISEITKHLVCLIGRRKATVVKLQQKIKAQIGVL